MNGNIWIVTNQEMAEKSISIREAKKRKENPATHWKIRKKERGRCREKKKIIPQDMKAETMGSYENGRSGRWNKNHERMMKNKRWILHYMMEEGVKEIYIYREVICSPIEECPVKITREENLTFLTILTKIKRRLWKITFLPRVPRDITFCSTSRILSKKFTWSR